MMYHLEDLFIINEIECKVSFVNTEGYAYLTPLYDDIKHGIFKGLVCSILNKQGKDSKGNKAQAIINTDCCAV